MQWIVKAEWISYDRTSIYSGTIALEIDSAKPVADYTADVWLVEADSKEDAIYIVGTPWEVTPTHIYAYQPNIRPWDKRVVHIGTERAHYWRSISEAAASLSSAVSDSTAIAARENGRKGGRPKKTITP